MLAREPSNVIMQSSLSNEHQEDDGLFNCHILTLRTKAHRQKRREVFCLFQAVEEPIILPIFKNAATLQPGYLD